MIVIAVFLFLLILALGLLYSPPSAWIGRNREKPPNQNRER